jgi:hypothetical protein
MHNGFDKCKIQWQYGCWFNMELRYGRMTLVSFDKVFQHFEKEYISLILELSQMELKWVQYFDYLRSNNKILWNSGNLLSSSYCKLFAWH